MRLIVLLLAIPLVLSKWGKPIQVIPYSYTNRAIFTDSTSGVSHLVWCNSLSGNFFYRQLSLDGTVSSEKTIATEHPCKLEYTLDGPHDGKTLYLVYQGTRRKDSDTRVCAQNKNNCHDIYFAESKDGGATWTHPIAVPREDMNDKMERQFPKLLLTKGGGIWIFYRMPGFYDAPYSYAVRVPGAAKFNNEVTLPIRVSTSAVLYNENNGENNVAIYYNDRSAIKKQKYYTTDGGRSWKGPEEIVFCEQKSDLLSRYPFNSFKMPSVFLVECRQTDYQYYLKKTFDNGKSWGIVSISQDEFTGRYTFADDGKGGGIIAYGTTNVYYMNTQGNAFKKMGVPPTPSKEHSIALTSSYNLKKIWFWYEINDPRAHTFSTWAIMADMETN